MYQMKIMYANRTETTDNISDAELGTLVENAFSHKEGNERAKEIVVFNLSLPVQYRKPDSTVPQPTEP
jgi:hypothetical protein